MNTNIDMFAIALPFRHPRSRRRATVATHLLRAWRGIDVRAANVLLLVMLTIGIIGYLALVNGNATAGYELRALEGNTEVLRDDVRRLELQALDARSINRLTERVAKETYVPVAHVEYVRSDHAVVQK